MGEYNVDHDSSNFRRGIAGGFLLAAKLQRNC